MNENFKDLKVNIYSLIQKQLAKNKMDEYIPYEDESPQSCLKEKYIKLKSHTKVFVKWDRVLLTALIVLNTIFLVNQNKLINSVSQQGQSLNGFSLSLKSLFNLYSQLKNQKETIIIRELHFFNQAKKNKTTKPENIKKQTVSSNILQNKEIKTPINVVQPESQVANLVIKKKEATIPENGELFSTLQLKPKTAVNEQAILESKSSTEPVIIIPSKKADSSLKFANNKKEGEYTYRELLEQSQNIYKNRAD